MKKDVVKKMAPEVPAQTFDGWGDDDLKAENVILPKMLLMQGLSDLVQSGMAMAGDICLSSGDKIGGEKEPFEFIPFHCQEQFTIMKDNGGGKPEFVRSEPVTSANSHLAKQFNFMEDGEKLRRYKEILFYVLPASNINGIPYVLSCRSTSLVSGKQLYTQMFVTNKAMGKYPASYHMTATPKHVKNDKGQFKIYTFQRGKESTPEEMTKAYTWFQTVKSGDTKIDDEFRDRAESAPREEAPPIFNPEAQNISDQY